MDTVVGTGDNGICIYHVFIEKDLRTTHREV